MRWTLGMDVDRNERVIYTPENDDVMLTYTADLLQCGACVPDFAPMYCNGVISMLAARLAPSMLGSEQMAQTLIAEAEAYLKEAIIEDRRQERSNDQHPLADILDMDITRYRTFKSQLYY